MSLCNKLMHDQALCCLVPLLCTLLQWEVQGNSGIQIGHVSEIDRFRKHVICDTL